jgi:hypothetical protein
MHRRGVIGARTRRSVLGLAVAIAAMGVAPVLAQVQSSLDTGHGVTPALARTAAAAAVGQTVTQDFAALRDAAAGTPIYESGVAGGDAAFVVPFVDSSGKQLGYVVTSASFDRTPILRISTGSWSSISSRRLNALRAGAGAPVVRVSTVHVDAFTEGAEATLADGSQATIVFDSGRMIRGQVRRDAAAHVPTTGTERQQWGSLLSTRPFAALVTTAHADPTSAYTIPGMPNYEWYKGCTPTAGFMTLAYWTAHGYSMMATTDYTLSQGGGGSSNTSPPTPTPGTASYITQLANDMHTDAGGGTYDTNDKSGLSAYLQQRGYPGLVNEWLNPAPYNVVSQWTMNGYPIMGGFSGWLYYSPTGIYYDGYAPTRIDHSVAIYGYQYNDTTGSYMILRDDAVEDGANMVAWDGNWSSNQLDIPVP